MAPVRWDIEIEHRFLVTLRNATANPTTNASFPKFDLFNETIPQTHHPQTKLPFTAERDFRFPETRWTSEKSHRP